MKGCALSLSAIGLLLLAMLPAVAVAQEALGGSFDEPFRKNSIGIAVGSLKEDPGEDDTQLSLEYIRWMDTNFGVGVDLDFVDSAKMVREWAIAVPAHWKFGPGFDFYVGPGYESQNSDIVGTEDDDDFFFRLGLGWEFELGQSNWHIEPMVEVDLFRSDHKYFFGVGVGYRF